MEEGGQCFHLSVLCCPLTPKQQFKIICLFGFINPSKSTFTFPNWAEVDARGELAKNLFLQKLLNVLQFFMLHFN